ncbi:efflux RND transporter permease subunit [Pelagibaculum spongiae]|uniref:Acriflavine resistance protein B n=1 Tax=Pelagibaculum spongiae TaxID=2080658 RepID=A0A2V1GTK5_9GAMM|nr:efflux RND transporter permease subunit [Pelagibaculum spongiae]PVZ67716.1 acriflavine resistance protein B [Pelagibaculum spongiae]
MISWFTRNPVAANLLMIFILMMGGWSISSRLPLEVFPDFELDLVSVSVSWPGAQPAEVEQTVTSRLEEEIFDLEGVKKISSTSSEGFSSVVVEVSPSYDPEELRDKIKNRLDALSTLPSGAERPTVNLFDTKREVISLVVSGDLPETELRKVAEQLRDELQILPKVSQVELDVSRDREVSIEVSDAVLRQYDLTLAQVAQAVSVSSLDLSAGNLRTQGGEILVTSRNQAWQRDDFEAIPLRSSADGSRLLLGDIATVIDGFEDAPGQDLFNGRPAMSIEIYRTGTQSAIEVADAVKAFVAERQVTLGDSVKLNLWRDRSKIVKARLNTLTTSAWQGGLLVLLLLSLFLRPSVAFWVFAGIPVCFLGGFALMPELGVSINVLSLFAFILVLGIVVDDAIVTGENIYTHLKKGKDPLQAAIEGTKEVAVPVTFGVLTTIAAFIPLMLIEGARGKLFAQIPYIIIPVLLFSLVESKLILPAHLRHIRMKKPGEGNRLSRIQQAIADGFERAILRFYQPFLEKALRWRGLSISVFIGLLIIIFSLVSSGWVKFVFFPRIESEVARGYLSMPAGTAFEITEGHVARMVDEAEKIQQKYIDPLTGESIILGISSSAGGGNSHVGRVWFEIQAPEKRTLDVSSPELLNEWRKAIGSIAGAENLYYRAEIGRTSDPVDIQLQGKDLDRLKQAALLIKQRLKQFPDIFDISDSLSSGKQELQIILKPEAITLGLTQRDLTSQVRNALYGFQAQRIQRDRDDIRVMVRYPKSERSNLSQLENLIIRTPDGARLPLNQLAELKQGVSPLSIERVNRFRTANVTADINKETGDVGAVMRALSEDLPTILADYSDVTYSLEGEAREQDESFSSLVAGLVFVLFVIYVLLAIPFKSYSQPLMVMSVIPFGAAAAVLGHLIMGKSLSIMSIMGMLALTGVVVNDSLVLVDYINRQKRSGRSLLEVVSMSGAARFRPVILTSLTTFAGLSPLLLEKSTQAQFLIPMAISLGFGVLFTTFVTLILIPVNYMLLEDLKSFFRKLLGITPKPHRLLED